MYDWIYDTLRLNGILEVVFLWVIALFIAMYLPGMSLKDCVECGSCWNICDFDAVIFEEPKGGIGVRFEYG